jgi:hypothetical protein
MFRFKRGPAEVPENAEQREELVDGLQYRIHKERAILKRRLTKPEPEPEAPKKQRAPRSRKAAETQSTGRLYEVFQALSYEDEN